MRFQDRVAIITGGAGGIGQAVARLMVREGARVVLADIDRPALEGAAARIREAGGEVIAQSTDVTDEGSVAALVRETEAAFGRIDILVNIVGGSTLVADPNSHIDRLTPAEWDSTIALNLRGTFLCARAVVPAMKRRRYGRIVNLSSIIARGDSRTSNVAYAAAKAGIRAMTRKMAVELGPYGITCNATAPGVTLTDRIQRLLASRSDGDPKTTARDVPLGRLSTPDEQARVILFLASDDAEFVSGQTLEVTGGQ
jgi:NAD(P)-dependent dehydrogenase (short-subunit alcohol dehydrogenase family)